MYTSTMSDSAFQANDFVYVDTDLKKAIGLVEWDKNGNPVPKEWPRVQKDPPPDAEGKPKRPARKPRARYYPWGSYHTMCKLYKLEGKVKDKDTDDYIKLDDAIAKLQDQPYWS